MKPEKVVWNYIKKQQLQIHQQKREVAHHYMEKNNNGGEKSS